jgi:hypothetical protein
MAEPGEGWHRAMGLNGGIVGNRILVSAVSTFHVGGELFKGFHQLLRQGRDVVIMWTLCQLQFEIEADWFGLLRKAIQPGCRTF